MKRSKMKPSSSHSPHSPKHLPPEMVYIILQKLPVKMLLRFRCVCKPWRSIIDNPNFVYEHLQLCNNNNKYNAGKLLSLEGSGSGGQYGCILTLRKAFNLRKIGNFFQCSQNRYHFYGMCNSLVLLGREFTFMKDDGLWLCNPSVKKSLKLPLSPLDPSRGQYTMFVFGFVPLTNDVKVIAFQLQQNRQIHVAVYTLSEGNWVVRENNGWVVRDNNNGFNFDFSCSFRELSGFYNRSNPSYLEGAIHWLGKPPPPDNANISDFRPTHLISLDLETESFSLLELPVLSDEDSEKWRFVFVLRRCLAVFNSSPTTSNIWLLNGDRTWTLWFSGPSSDLVCRLFTDLDQRSSVLYFDGDGDGDVGSLVYEKSSYSIASGQVRSMGKSMTNFVDFKLYSESLVLAGIHDDNSPFSWN